MEAEVAVLNVSGNTDQQRGTALLAGKVSLQVHTSQAQEGFLAEQAHVLLRNT